MSDLEAAARPLLATSAQVDAEQTLMRLLRDPELRRIQAEIREELAARPRGRTESGAATLDHAIALWTNSLVLAEISIHQPTPAFTWGTDNTPRTWMGYTLSGVGTSGDNPDAVLHKGAKVTPPPMDGNMSDLMPLASISDRDLDVAPDGTFRFTVGRDAESAVHMTSAPGMLTLGIRDILSDWRQRPCMLEFRPLDEEPAKSHTDDDILRATYKDLPPYIRFWASFPERWFGGLSGTTITPVQVRNGSMAGCIAAMSFDLAPDEAILVTTLPVGAAYTGFQIIDPWMLSVDVTEHPVSLNKSQTVPNADGSFTYVISRSDPGLANWLSTGDLSTGLGIVRWQAMTDIDSVRPADLVREFRVVTHAELEGMPDLPRVTAQQRKEQSAQRAETYASRTS
ncbi:hypothetical protein [Nocardia alni]|uniref:hypothetical protein n=1 Tax=Nocardia alni TaxID=2815723 RepID=UPI001C24B193|nr:hypothetical protein [Nocardia alni]